MNWYYVRNGERQGPVEEEALRRLLATGGIKADDLVWNETLGDEWKAASAVPGLLGAPDLAISGSGSAERPVSPPRDGLPGQTHNRDLMAKARASLSGQWGTGVAAAALYLAISLGLGLIPFGGLLIYLIGGPLYVGFCILFLSLIRSRGTVGQMFEGFQQFGKATGTYLLMILFIILWTLLLIIPGIIMGYAYSMAFFVRADDPQVGCREALTRSVEMMRGYKWKLFCLFCRFIGWGVLAMLTCGVGYLWLMPYLYAAMAQFYEDVRPSPGVGQKA